MNVPQKDLECLKSLTIFSIRENNTHTLIHAYTPIQNTINRIIYKKKQKEIMKILRALSKISSSNKKFNLFDPFQVMKPKKSYLEQQTKQASYK